MTYCEKCGNKLALVTGYVSLESDDEPYEAGEGIVLGLLIEKFVMANYCEKCDELTDIQES